MPGTPRFHTVTVGLVAAALSCSASGLVVESFDYVIDGPEGNKTGGQNGAGTLPKNFSTAANGVVNGGTGFSGPWQWVQGNPDASAKIVAGMTVPSGVDSDGGALQLYRASLARPLDSVTGGAGSVTYVSFALRHTSNTLQERAGFALTSAGSSVIELSRGNGNSDVWDFIAPSTAANPDNLYSRTAVNQNTYWMVRIDQTGSDATVSVKRYEDAQHDLLADSYDHHFTVPHFTFDGVKAFYPNRPSGSNEGSQRGIYDEIRIASTFQEAVGQAPDSFVPNQVVRTFDGNGADTQVRRLDASDFGSDDSLRVTNQPGAGGAADVGTWLRFDFGNVDKTDKELVAAQLLLTLNTGGSTGLRTFNVFGVNDDVTQDWIESGAGHITWADAPGNLLTSGTDGDPLTSTLLGQFVLENSSLADVQDGVRFTSSALLDFLNADTDGLVTLFLKRVEQDDQQTNFASRENGANIAPGLFLQFRAVDPQDTAPAVPEPASAALATFGAMLLLKRRRRQH